MNKVPVTAKRSRATLERVHLILQEKITNGAFRVGERLPTIAEIAETFACSDGIASKAIAMLVQSGLVEQRRKLGTRVIDSSKKKESLHLDAVAIVYPSEQHEGTWRTLQGFSSAAQERGHRVVMLGSGMDFRKEAEVIGRLGEFDVKGAVLYPIITNPADDIYYRQMILACPFPVVLVAANLPGVGRSSVVSDGLHAGYTMTKHLLAKGCRKIGFVSNGAAGPSMRDRYLGYRQAMDETSPRTDYSYLEPKMRPDYDDPLKENYMVACRFFEKYPDMQAVVCGTDFMAWGLIQAAKERGLSVPEDLKVVGIDDHAQRQNASHSLTTYHIPFEEMGSQSFHLLQALIENSETKNQEMQLRGHIVVRESDAS